MSSVVYISATYPRKCIKKTITPGVKRANVTNIREKNIEDIKL